MRILVRLIIFTALLLKISISTSFAASAPIIIEPQGDSIVSSSSPKLSWQFSDQCIQDGSCFRVEVDNNSDFSSLEKSTYTSGFSYSPQGLSEGKWFWRVKGKDTTETWSDWAQSSFILASPTSTSPPSPLNSPTPTPSSTQPQGGTNNFSISSSPSSVDVSTGFQVQVLLNLPSNPNTSFYLKGAFKKADSSNYFGKTQVNGIYVENGSGYQEQLKIQTDASGTWSGSIHLMGDNSDSGYTGAGNYILKVARYSLTGSGPTWSNEVTINLTGEKAASQTGTTQAISSPKSSPSPLPSSKVILAGNNPIQSNTSKNPLPSSYMPLSASSEAEATPEADVNSAIHTKSGKLNWYFLLSGILLMTAIITTLVIKYKLRISLGG